MGKYILKKFNRDLIQFELQKNIYGDFECLNIKAVGDEKDFPERLKRNNKDVLGWLRSRIIPRNREFVHEILRNQGLSYNDLEGIINVCLGLSVNDVYWVVPERFHGKFEDYNLYENSFSNALGLVAFTGYSQTINELSPSPEMTTNGQLPKAWRRINNDLYLYKGGSDSSFANGGNEPYSEFYASQVAKKMGINHVEYDLEQWKGMLASVCKNFTSIEYSYVPLGHILDNRYSLENLKKLVQKLNIEKEFTNMILFDAVILNEDRHLGNFGLLKNNYTNRLEKMAPLFDHGVSLFSYLSEKDLKNNLRVREFIESHNISALGSTHDELVRLFCDKTDVKKLVGLYNFKLTKHERYNLSDQRIKCIEELIQSRAKELVKILTSPDSKSTLKINTSQKDPIVKNEFLGYQYEYQGDDWKGEYTIWKNNRIVKEGMIQPEDVKEMDPFTYIETEIEKIFNLEQNITR